MDKAHSQQLVVARAAAAALLIVALADLPYGYYTFMRIAVCAVSGYSAYVSFGQEKLGWGWTMAVVAVLFNPLVPIHLSRGAWAPIDVATAVVLLVSIPALRDATPSH